MDLETLNQLERSLIELRDAVQQNAKYLDSLGSSMRSMGGSLDRNTQSSKKASESASRASEGANDFAKAYSDSEKEFQNQSQRYNNALNTTVDATKSFTRAVLSAESNLSKYSSGIKGLGGAAEALTRGTSGFTRGAALGAVAYTKLLESALSVDDQLIKFRDSFTDTAGVLPMTTNEIKDLAGQAGFSMDDMAKLSKRVNELGPSLLGLGGYAGQGAKKFMEMVSGVTSEQRRKFNRLGINQDMLLDYMGKYVEAQYAMGNASSLQDKKGRELTQAAEDYAEELQRWSSLTGKKADQIQKDREQSLDTIQERIKETQEQDEIGRLRERAKHEDAASAAADRARADELDQQSSSRKRVAMALGQFSQDMAHDFTKYMNGGGASYRLIQSGLLQRWHEMTDAQKKSKEAGVILLDGIAKTAKEHIASPLGDAAIKGSEKNAEDIMAVSADFVHFINQNTKGISQRYNDIQNEQDNIKNDPNRDPLIETYSSIKQFELDVKSSLQYFLGFIDPLQTAFGALAGLFGLMAAGGFIGKLFGGAGGKLFGGGAAAAEEAALAETAAAGESKLTGKALQDSLKAERRAAAMAEVQAKKALGKEVAEEVTEKGFRKFIPKFFKHGMKSLLSPKNVSTFLKDSAKSLFTSGNILKFGKTLGKGLAGIAGGIALDYGADYAKTHGHEKLGAGLDVASSALTGASIGATIGSIIPGAGTLIGGAIGGVLGSAYGLYQNWGTLTKSDKPETTTMNSVDALRSILDQIKLLQRYDFDLSKINKNTQALGAFVGALVNMSNENTTIGGEERAKSIKETITQFLSIDIPTEAIVNFSKLPLDPDKTKRNAMAFVNFAQAMSSYTGVTSGLGNITHIIALALQEQFKVKLPLDDFQRFAGMSIDAKKAERNSKAFVNFANAMAEYKGGPGIIDVVTAWAGKKVSELFGQDGPIDAFSKFAKMDFGPRANSNADAFRKYAESIGIIRDAQSNQPQQTDSTTAPPPNTPQQSAQSQQPNQPAQPSLAKRAYDFAAGIGSAAVDLGSNLWNAAVGTGKHEQGVRPDVIGRKQALEKIMGNKLVVSSGVRPGTPNHGSGSAIDLGFNSNPMLAQSEQNRNKLIANAINLGFTGIGAEYHASGGAHIHLDINHPRLTGWGSDYTGKSLMRDSPWLFNYLNKVGAQKAQYGGIFDDSFDPQLPKAQKLASLHTDSLLSKLAKTNADQMKATLDSTNQSHHDHDTEMTLELYNMIDGKLNQVLNALESSHSTHNKMLRHMV